MIDNNRTTIIHQIRQTIASIVPCDQQEREHIELTKKWIDSGADIFRIAKPATPNQHLVAYFVLIDPKTQHILLVDHKNSGLWLPAGGHVELNEHPKETVEREIVEELGIQARFLSHDPFFLTVTKTVGQTAGHTDVSLWYALEGCIHDSYTFDHDEFSQIRWFLPGEIPYERTDPHMKRWINKLTSLMILDDSNHKTPNLLKKMIYDI